MPKVGPHRLQQAGRRRREPLQLRYRPRYRPPLAGPHTLDEPGEVGQVVGLGTRLLWVRHGGFSTGATAVAQPQAPGPKGISPPRRSRGLRWTAAGFCAMLSALQASGGIRADGYATAILRRPFAFRVGSG